MVAMLRDSPCACAVLRTGVKEEMLPATLTLVNTGRRTSLLIVKYRFSIDIASLPA